MADLIRLTGQMSSYWRPATEADRLALEGVDTVKAAGDKSRTSLQNNAMWRYCDTLAKALNDAGFTVLTFPWKDGFELDFTKEICMKNFWRPVMDVMIDLESTRDQTTTDVQLIYRSVDRAVSTRTGVTVEWPCIDNQRIQR